MPQDTSVIDIVIRMKHIFVPQDKTPIYQNKWKKLINNKQCICKSNVLQAKKKF